MLQAFIKDDFADLLDYQQWVRSSFANISSLNEDRIFQLSKEFIQANMKIDPNWFGKGTTFNELQKGVSTYKDPKLIEQIYGQVSDSVSLTLKDRIKSRKVNYNSTGLGVFIFDRAAMGMYRIKELYSPSLSRVVEKAEVIKEKDGYKLLADGSVVHERWELKQDGTPRIRTISKNIYAYFPRKDKEKRAVEIYLACGGPSSINARDFLYSGVSAIVVAQILERANIDTKISIVIGTSPDEFSKKVYACIVPVKKYDERLDTNLLALLSSDPRFYRYDGLKGVLGIYDHFGARVSEGFGYGFNNRENLKRTIENSTYTLKAKLAPNRIYMGRIFSESEAIRDVSETMKTLTDKLNAE